MSMVLYDVPIDHVSEHQLDTLLRLWIKDHAQKVIVTPNPEIVLRARKDPAFRAQLQASHLSLPDGVGLRFAIAALTDRQLRFRHTGVDTLIRLAQICEDYGKRLVLFGGKGDVASKTAMTLRAQFPDLDVVSMNPGDEVADNVVSMDPDILAQLQDAKPTVVAVAFGAGKQEVFLHTHLHRIPTARIGIGVGGAFDMMSGALPRAPFWMRRVGLEWVWRLLQEPARWRRIWMAAIVFPVIVAYDSLRGRKFSKALLRVIAEVARQLTGK